MAEFDEMYYSTIILRESRLIQIWSNISGKFLGSVVLDENLVTWTPFYSKDTSYLPINWAIEKLRKELCNGK